MWGVKADPDARSTFQVPRLLLEELIRTRFFLSATEWTRTAIRAREPLPMKHPRRVLSAPHACHDHPYSPSPETTRNSLVRVRSLFLCAAQFYHGLVDAAYAGVTSKIIFHWIYDCALDGARGHGLAWQQFVEMWVLVCGSRPLFLRCHVNGNLEFM
jgi:hypothetical protein